MQDLPNITGELMCIREVVPFAGKASLGSKNKGVITSSKKIIYTVTIAVGTETLSIG